jgi:hypothetical protein
MNLYHMSYLQLVFPLSLVFSSPTYIEACVCTLEPEKWIFHLLLSLQIHNDVSVFL